MRAFTSRTLLALTLAAWSGTAALAAAAPVAASAASSSQPGVSAAFAAPFNAAQDMLKSGNGTGALAKLKEVAALPNLTPYEQYLIVRVRAPAEYAANDTTAAAADFDSLLSNDQLPPSDRVVILKALASIQYTAEQYPKAAVTLQRYFDAGGDDAQLREILPQVQYMNKDFAAAAKGLKAQIDATYAAGKVPQERLLRLLASAYSQTNDDASYLGVLERLAVAYPKNPDYWKELIGRVAHTEKFSDHLYTDNYRLKAQVLGSVADNERLSYAELADHAGYPEEAKRIFDEAYASPHPFTGPDLAEANKVRASVNKSVASDKAQDSMNLSAAHSAKDGNSLFSLGLLKVVDGDAAGGLDLMQQGVAKGGLRNPEEARLHLGYAQIKAGHDADALKTFQSITSGPAGIVPMAHVWALYAQSRLQVAAPAPVAAASK